MQEAISKVIASRKHRTTVKPMDHATEEWVRDSKLSIIEQTR